MQFLSFFYAKNKKKKINLQRELRTLSHHHQALRLWEQQLRDCSTHERRPQPDPHGTNASRSTKQSPACWAACQNPLKKENQEEKKHTSLENSFIQIFLNIESTNKSTTWLVMQVPFASSLTVTPAHTWTQHLLPEGNSGNSLAQNVI